MKQKKEEGVCLPLFRCGKTQPKLWDKLVVSGSIGDYSDNRLCFSFFADQTGLSLLSNVLKKLIDI